MRLTKTKGVIVRQYSEMLAWGTRHELPSTLKEVVDFQMYAIPFPAEAFPNTEAVVLTMHVQINWIGLLVNGAMYFPVHMDGKAKLHHGGWYLITFGTHVLKFRDGSVHHTFRPLVYMFVKQRETAESIHLGLYCCNVVAQRFYQKPFDPQVGIADHGPGIRVGFNTYTPRKSLLGCFAHIVWHLTHGKTLKVGHPKHEEVVNLVKRVHHCETPGMWNVITAAIGRLWCAARICLVSVMYRSCIVHVSIVYRSCIGHVSDVYR